MSGLEGVIAAQSSICFIDGAKGILSYRGYDINELAPNATFEETVFLLWEGRLPTADELAAFKADLASRRELPQVAMDVLEMVAEHMTPMDALRTVTSALAAAEDDPDNAEVDAGKEKAKNLTAQVATIIAHYHRIRSGQDVLASKPELSHAGNFLWLLNGKEPTPAAERAMDVALILHADHDLNASTFAARVTAGTLADMHAAVTSGIGALKGPLHGGANIGVMKMLLEIDESGTDTTTWVKEALAAKKRIMGFGHRVYKTLDPRAVHLEALSKDLAEQAGDMKWYDMSLAIQKEVKAQKNLDANVDFFSASSYYTMGIPLDLYTPIFALARVSGWTAHVLEQHGNNRLIRPLSDYTGELGKTWVPVEERTVTA
ncbi:MAG: citrate/2-methylcitrate synthase [Thermoplasmatota archaeon]